MLEGTLDFLFVFSVYLYFSGLYMSDISGETQVSVCAASPWTVVVHSAYTVATSTAVVGPFRSH